MRIDIEIYATILLIGRLISMSFIFMVLRRQWGLFHIPIAENIKHFRKVLFALALVIFVGNLVPLAIDLYTLLGPDASDGRPATVSAIGFLYSSTANLTALVSSYLIWRLYRLAAETKVISDHTEQELKDDNKQRSDIL